MATPYDETILERFADDLYKKADAAVAQLMVLWFLLGLIVGSALSGVIRGASPGMTIMTSIGVGLFIGFALGSERAFKFRLEAQRTLCQVAMERNTREKHPGPCGPGAIP